MRGPPDARASWGATHAVRSPEIRDLGWSLLIAGLLALSPLTGAGRVWASLVLGGLGGAIVFALRVRRRAREGAPPLRPAPLAPPGPAVGAMLVAWLAVFAPTIAWLYEVYTESIWRNGHGLFVPVVMALLARSRLRGESAAPGPSAWGFAFLVPGLALVIADSGVRSDYLAALALALSLPGLSLLLLGTRLTRRLALPLGLSVFLIPIPSAFENPLGLPSVTAAGMEPLLRLLGIPALRHQTSFSLSDGWLSISQGCSGLSTLHAGVALAVLLGFTTRSPWRRALLLTAPWPLIVVINIVRGVALVALCDAYGTQVLETPLHGLSGLVVFWSMVAAMALAADRRSLREAMA